MCRNCILTIHLGDKMKRDQIDGKVWDVWGEEICVQGLVRNGDRRRPLSRPWHRWEDGIKMDVTEIGWHGIDWIHLAHVMYMWQALLDTVIFHVS